MKKSFLIFLIPWALALLTTAAAWAGGIGGGTNPFYPDKTYQGFSLLRVVFKAESSATDEYYVYPIYGVDPGDGVGTLYNKRPQDSTQYISNKRCRNANKIFIN